MKYLLSLLFIALSLFAKDEGSVLYNSCQYCHGTKAEKVYVNIVPSIKNLDANTLQTMLILYKKGQLNTYGFEPIMKTQMKNIPESKIPILAEYITNL